MEGYIRTLIGIFMALYVCNGSAFLLSTVPSECPLPHPCTCYHGLSANFFNIYCTSKGLTAIPQIVQYNTNVYVNSVTIYLQGNSLTTIPSNAFSNLRSINTSSIDMQLYSNIINTIENDAFDGVENITTLYLNSNNLTVIPFAISKLTRLQILYITGNPLSSIDSSVMSQIGGSLTTLFLDLGGFSVWPADLQYLTNLKILQVNGISFSHLDINAFHGFENTLTSLTMHSAKLNTIPQGICQLTRLTSLSFTKV